VTRRGFARRTSLFAFAVALAGCSALQPQAVSVAGSQPRSATSSGSLLYASDWQTGSIYFFNYPGGTLAGTIADDLSPLGLCSDANGNVWVANFGAGSNQLVEYAHGGTTPIATLDDPGEQPRGCSVDPTTGNLAVANGNPGSVVIYPQASGIPQSYDPQLVYPVACTYDGEGNLFVDGYHLRHGDQFALSELPVGGGVFKKIRIKDQLGLPGNIAWDGTYHDGTELAIGDYQSPSVIYVLDVKRRLPQGNLETTISLDGPKRDAAEGVQFWIGDGTLIMPFGLQKKIDEIGMWSFPAGGAYQSELSGFGAAELYGVTISR
jgi:DNA-binding beta-propeller fold protein YncE